MSKTRNKTHSEIEHFRATIRKLQSEVRRLKRLLKDSQKHEYTPADDEPAEEILQFKLCPNCGKGLIQETDLGKFIFIKCSLCDFKQRKKT